MSKMWTVNDVAEYLRITPFTVRDKCRKGLLPGKKLKGGKSWFFDGEEITGNFFARNCVNTQQNQDK